jgi:signal transduction histidine kinase
MGSRRGAGWILVVVLGLGAALVALGILVHAVETTRRASALHDRGPVLALADSLATQVGMAVADTESRLLLARILAREADTTSRRVGLRRILRDAMDHGRYVTGLAVRWEDGRVLAAGDGPLPGAYPKDLDDRDRLILEGPIILDPARGIRILRLIRPLSPAPGPDGPAERRDPDSANGGSKGAEGGWVLADLSLDGPREAFAATVNDLPGASAALVMETGQVLTEEPPSELPANYRFPGFQPGGHPVDGSLAVDPRRAPDGTQRLVAYRQVPGLPLWVAVSLPHDPALAAWWRGPTPWVAAGAIILLACLSLMVLALLRGADRDRALRIATQRQTLLMAQTRVQKAILGAVTTPVVVLDGRGRIVQTNEAFGQWAGLGDMPVRGRSPAELLPDSVATFLIQPPSVPEGETRELAWPRPDGHRRRVLATTRPLAPPPRGVAGDRAPRRPDRPVAKVVAFLDLTDGVSLAEDLGRAKATLRTFAQAIAEDLRGPLGELIGRVALLERRQSADLDGDSRQALRQAIVEGEHMRVLIDDILDYAQIALAPPPRAGADTNAALERALEGLSRDIKETGADIRSAILPSVRCGEAQLTSLLRILVGDAIERTPPGQTPRVRVDGTEGDGTVILTVTDGGGDGATPEAGTGTPPARPALGVGLALCGEIVRHAGGDLSRSTARDGTTVRMVSLPAAPSLTRPAR